MSVTLDLLTGDGSGDFSDTSTYQTVGQPNFDTLGLVAGDFQGSEYGPGDRGAHHQRRRRQ